MNSKLNVVKKHMDEIIEQMNLHIPLSVISSKLNMKHETLKHNLKILGVKIQTNQGGKGIAGGDYLPAMHYITNGIYISAPRLRNKLFRDGLKEQKCECCGLTEWMNKPIPLELHHKDHNHFNNDLNNLEVLCSNCHAQRHGYSSKNKV